jgi:uncharacterized protein (DUF2141 family)
MCNRKSGGGIIEIALSLALLAGMCGMAAAGSINVTVTDVRSEQGVIRCGLFASAVGFREPGKELIAQIGKIQGNHSTCAFNSVPEGTYAIAVFHAEQGEMQLAFGLFGKPKQGVGFSRNPGMLFGPPSFEASAFPVGNAPVNLTVKLNY